MHLQQPILISRKNGRLLVTPMDWEKAYIRLVRCGFVFAPSRTQSGSPRLPEIRHQTTVHETAHSGALLRTSLSQYSAISRMCPSQWHFLISAPVIPSGFPGHRVEATGLKPPG